MKEPFIAKASPKTLKQQLKEVTCNSETYREGSRVVYTHVAELLFKEWLTQKRQQLEKQNKIFVRGNYSNEYRLLNELLEELNHSEGKNNE